MLLGNLVPLAGALVLGWPLGMVLVAYWLETVVVGAFALLRILFAGGPPPNPSFPLRVALAGFFTVHFGLFVFVHGIFVTLLAAGETGGSWRLGSLPLNGPLNGPVAVASDLALVLGGLVVANGIAFVREYVLGTGRGAATAQHEMARPYGRILVQHFVILAGGFLAIGAGGGAWVLVPAMLVKLVLEALGAMRPPVFRLAGGTALRRPAGEQGPGAT